uniref:Uncharacterized protein n=1 Tax=viral metagenome TaxID=1070528 RepID=A0A6C0IYH6_9ZZZZ
MGNRISRSFDYGTFARLIEEGPNYLLSDQSVWTQSERRCLKDFLSFFKERGLPWANSAHEAFARVKLAVPKSKMAAEIHAYVENPTRKDLEAFDSLQPRAQIAWAHFYALVLFMWSLQQGRPCALIFYESDLLYYVFQSEDDVDYDRIDLFIRALEKIQVVGSFQSPKNLVRNRLLVGPFILISGLIRSGSTTIKAEGGPRLIEPGVYLTDGPVTIAGVETTEANPKVEENLSRIKHTVQKLRESISSHDDSVESEKSGRYPKEAMIGRHFLSRQEDETWNKEESSEEEEPSSVTSPHETSEHEHCGPSNTREYLDEILFRLDALCRFHKRLGFE